MSDLHAARRERYRDAIHDADTLRADPLSRDYLRADAAIAEADIEIQRNTDEIRESWTAEVNMVNAARERLEQENARLRAKRNAAYHTLRRIRTLHSPYPSADLASGQACLACHSSYPCKTISILDGGGND